MEPGQVVLRKALLNRIFTWDKKFEERNATAYPAEDSILQIEPGETQITAFLKTRIPRLQPPQFNYVALRTFLEKGDEAGYEVNSSLANYINPVAWIDDRRDDTGWKDFTKRSHHSARDWKGYASYPPKGDKVNTLFLNPKDLHKHQSTKVTRRS